MTDLDDRIRELVRTIGEAAPEPPSIHGGSRVRQVPRRGPWVAVAAFVAVLAVFAGLGWVFDEDDQATPSSSTVVPSSTVASSGSTSTSSGSTSTTPLPAGGPIVAWRQDGIGMSDSFATSSGRLLLSDDRQVYVASGHGGSDDLRAVTALDLATGEVRWQRDHVGETQGGSVFLQTLLSGQLIVNGQYHTVRSVGTSGGDIRWTFSLPESYGAVGSAVLLPDGETVLDPVLLVTAEAPREGDTRPPLVFAFEYGSQRWGAELAEGTDLQWHPPAVSDGVLFVSATPSHPGSAPGNIIHAVAVVDGEVLWQAELGGEQGFHSYPTLISGDVLFTRGGEGVVALDVVTGAERWRFDGRLAFPLVLTADGDLIATDGELMVVLDQETGQDEALISATPLDGMALGAMLSSSGELIVVTPTRLHAFDSSGIEEWSWEAGDRIVDWDLNEGYAILAIGDRGVVRVDYP